MRMLQRLRFRLRSAPGMVLTAAVAGLIVAPDAILRAQEPPPQTTTAAAEAEPDQAPTLSQDQLQSLVAPIALYPDPLLSQCLVASTYPLDIMEAAQWVSKNPDLKGDALTEAAKKQDWDPSIQAMVALPEVMKRMSENIKWTTDLGNAFLAQESDVMNAVQALRVKAKDAGKLQSNEQMNVETKVVETKTIVEIQPASTQVVYVPSYSPTVIWGPPAYPYPPVYYPPYTPGAALFTFGMGMAMGAAISGGWGWNCGWGGGGNNTININNNNTFVNNSNRTNNVNRSGNSNWSHDGNRRGGVPYQDRSTANKYGGGARGDSAQARQQQARSRESANPATRGGGQGNLGASRGAGGATAGSFERGGAGGNYAGSRDMSSRSSAGGGSAFSGGSGSHERSASGRGASSMGSRGGGGMSRGGGGGRRR